ncbi:reverse transcriptase domain-containing protein [uncultured Desulfobacter sp.]|uniref:RNA-directed DNA polymerase n=1 Tax=uncultured Desulfobacter sp. TaxID=240139 RepID=UPI0029F4FDEE|nr:reverse transcriptase domain-containing protein [uncultured Desulfobacter sp.]
MTLNTDSIEWALDFLKNHSDGDIFPKILEIDSINEKREDLIAQLSGKPLNQFSPGACRRFIVPKDEISYRQATQLDPQDSIILTSLIYQFGSGIESRRLPNDLVFSYRFAPTVQDGLYGGTSTWNSFWTKAFDFSSSCSTILYCDIADFYNQIYHHTVENQLIASGIPNQGIKWIISLLESTTAGVSRGVPIGPHAIHLIAEATLIPVDNSLSTNGIKFLRYADDIVVFCNSEKESKKALSDIAKILDKQQRLMLQRHKTKFFTPDEFKKICTDMIQDRPISFVEANLLKLINKYSGGDPYKVIFYNQISPEDWQSITEETISSIIEEYINSPLVDYIRLRWFYRRLTQIGHPGAINVSLDNLEKLGPCFSNICTYLSSVQSIDPEKWKEIGQRLLLLLESDEVKNNEFFRLSIISLFTRNQYINHFATLANMFQSADPYARREIFLSAKANNSIDWLREHKEDFVSMDPWQKMAFIHCASCFPADEKKYFINQMELLRPFEKTLAKWSKSI